MYIFSDNDESVGQGAGAAPVLWMWGRVVAEHSLNVESQQKMQEAALLSLLMKT